MMQKHKSVISVLKVFLKNYSRAYQLRHKKKIRKSFFLYKHAVKNLEGLEIGGPSRIFKKVLPIYHYSQSIDGVNFSESTLWEKDLTDSSAYNYYFDKTGTQFIMEATNLEKIQSSFYDFVASSHCLEHTANPLKALLEWKRVVKEDGYLILVLPNKINNFDRNRATTKFSHILDDFKMDISEHDLTHLDEIVAKHDYDLDSGSESMENFIKRGKNNFVYRGLHHHVFDEELVELMLSWCRLKLFNLESDNNNIFVLAQKNSSIKR